MALDLYSKGAVDTLLAARLSISSLSNGAATNIDATAPTNGQVLGYSDATTSLVWLSPGGGGSTPQKVIADIAASCLVFDNYTPQIIFMGPIGYSVASSSKYGSGSQYLLGIGTPGSSPSWFSLSSSNDSAGHMIATSGTWGSYSGQSIAYSDDYGSTWTYSDLVI